MKAHNRQHHRHHLTPIKLHEKQKRRKVYIQTKRGNLSHEEKSQEKTKARKSMREKRAKDNGGGAYDEAYQ